MDRKWIGAALASALLPAALSAQASDYGKEAAKLLASGKFKTAAARIDADYDRVVGDIVALTEIEAPPFKEEQRARVYLRMLREQGLSDVEMDEEGNVMGLRKGSGQGPLVVIAAHLDTVFPAGTDVKVRREGNTLHAPGVGDDTSSLPVLLAFARAMDAAGYRTSSDILFVGDVGEEGPGDLRGMRYLFNKGKYKDRIRYFISFEPGRAGRITNGGVGSRRYKLTFAGPGGHSYGAFGLVSPAFALGQAMVEFGRIQVPETPKTTYNVGVIEGGTSVNSIPFAMSMTVDMRSAGKAELDALEQQFLAIPAKAVAAENAARSTAKGEITYQLEPVGDRPVGQTDPDKRIARIASAVARAGGVEPQYGASSTDANVPMSLGIEALTLGGGFESSRAHSLDEFVELDRAADVHSMSLGLATVLMLAGAK
ncbi:MAG: M20/M25/M40 family metallo-hydrolase [Solimonas sp.]